MMGYETLKHFTIYNQNILIFDSEYFNINYLT